MYINELCLCLELKSCKLQVGIDERGRRVVVMNDCERQPPLRSRE